MATDQEPPAASLPSSPRNSTSESTPYTASDDLLSPLEAKVLNEYARLRANLDALSSRLAELAAQPSANVADGMRMLERKTALVCTALKSSVYGIVLQQSIEGDGGLEDGNRNALGLGDGGEQQYQYQQQRS